MPTSTIQPCSTPDRGRPAWLTLIQIQALIDSAFFFLNRQEFICFCVTLTSHITANASGMKWECRKSHLVNIISKKIIIDITLIMLLFTWPFVMLRLKALKSTPFPLIYCAMGFVAYMDRIRFVRLPPKRYQHTNVYYHIFILKFTSLPFQQCCRPQNMILWYTMWSNSLRPLEKMLLFWIWLI